MKIYYCEQRSEEWYALRCGRMTASEAMTIAANGKGLETYVYGVMAEKYSQNREVGYIGKDMERGIELEDQARMTYEIENDPVEKVGFIEEDEYTGCSPDGLVGDEGGTEIKCVNDANFFRILVDGYEAIEKKFIWQCQMSLLISKRKWWDLVIYNPNFEKNMLVFRIEPELAKQERLIVGIAKGKLLIDQLTQKYESRNGKI